MYFSQVMQNVLEFHSQITAQFWTTDYSKLASKFVFGCDIFSFAVDWTTFRKIYTIVVCHLVLIYFKITEI